MIGYHYTSAEAIRSICGSKSLRFTDTEYLNDALEMKVCADVFCEAWTQAMKDLGEARASRIGVFGSGEELAHAVAAEPYADVDLDFLNPLDLCRYRNYVFCCSEAADDAGMWLRYASKNEAKYCLEIKVDGLVSELNRLLRPLGVSVFFGKTIYQREDQIAVLRRLIDETICRLETSDSDCDRPSEIAWREGEWADDLVESVRRVRALFKQQGYISEREMRVVLRVPNSFQGCLDSDQILRTEVGVGPRDILVPYAYVGFAERISEIVCGIQVFHPDESSLVEAGLRRLLEECNLSCISTSCSKVKLRW